MPEITGNIRDVGGISMVGKQVQLVFTLNRPNVVAAGFAAGRLQPTEPVKVTPDALGDWSVTLSGTTTMYDDAWYSLQIHWLDGSKAPVDFPDWRIVVPSSGGMLQDLIGGSATNLSLVFISLTAPVFKAPFMLWYKTDPGDPTNANQRNTGLIYRWENL